MNAAFLDKQMYHCICLLASILYPQIVVGSTTHSISFTPIDFPYWWILSISSISSVSTYIHKSQNTPRNHGVSRGFGPIFGPIPWHHGSVSCGAGGWGFPLWKRWPTGAECEPHRGRRQVQRLLHRGGRQAGCTGETGGGQAGRMVGWLDGGMIWWQEWLEFSVGT